MTKSQQRIEILQDAIQQVESKAYIPTQGILVYVLGGWRGLDNPGGSYLVKKEQLQIFLLNKKTQCRVCARGAIITSLARRYGSLSYGDFIRYLHQDDVGIEVSLLELFSKKTLDRMEILFEGYISDNFHSYYHNAPEGGALLRESENLPKNLKEKLLAIFRAEIEKEKRNNLLEVVLRREENAYRGAEDFQAAEAYLAEQDYKKFV